MVCSVTLGGCASSFVLTCWRPGMGMLVAGGNELRVEVEFNVGIGVVVSLKRRAYTIITNDTKKIMNGIASGPPSSITRLITRKTGKRTPLKNISFAARRIPLRRGEAGEICTSSLRCAGSPPPASHSVNPLSARPQREQNLISSESCC